MTARQIEQLVKMANQIALNMAAWGDEQVVAHMTGEHLQKFWTPAMCRQLVDYRQSGGDGLSPVVEIVLASMDEAVGDRGQPA